MKEVVLDHERSASHPLHLLHERFGIDCMVKNIDCHRDVELPGGKRQVRSVKFADADGSVWSNQYIHPFNSEIGPHREQRLVQQTISTSDVEDAR